MLDFPEDNTMDINTKIGSKVRFSFPENGTTYDKETARKYLKINETYTIKNVYIGGWRTDIILEEFPTIEFNSAQFENI